MENNQSKLSKLLKEEYNLTLASLIRYLLDHREILDKIDIDIDVKDIRYRYKQNDKDYLKKRENRSFVINFGKNARKRRIVKNYILNEINKGKDINDIVKSFIKEDNYTGEFNPNKALEKVYKIRKGVIKGFNNSKKPDKELDPGEINF